MHEFSHLRLLVEYCTDVLRMATSIKNVLWEIKASSVYFSSHSASNRKSRVTAMTTATLERHTKNCTASRKTKVRAFIIWKGKIMMKDLHRSLPKDVRCSFRACFILFSINASPVTGEVTIEKRKKIRNEWLAIVSSTISKKENIYRFNRYIYLSSNSHQHRHST